MKRAKVLDLWLLVAALAVVGCSWESSTSTGGSKKESSGHSHGKGPNQGVVFDLGKYHAEFTVDHDKKECMVLVLGDDEKTPAPVAAKELTVTTKETKVKEGADKGKVVPPMTIKLQARDAKDGKASKFVGTDPGLGNVADFEGTVLGEIDSKPSEGKFKE